MLLLVAPFTAIAQTQYVPQAHVHPMHNVDGAAVLAPSTLCMGCDMWYVSLELTRTYWVWAIAVNGATSSSVRSQIRRIIGIGSPGNRRLASLVAMEVDGPAYGDQGSGVGAHGDVGHGPVG